MHSDKKQTIFITVFHSFVSKNILNTSILDNLLLSGCYKIVLLVPAKKEKYFKTEYARPGIDIESVPANTLNTRAEKILGRLSKLVIDTHYLHYKRVELLNKESSIRSHIKYALQSMFVRLFAGHGFSRKIFRLLNNKYSNSPFFKEILVTHKPDLVFSTDIFDPLDQQILNESKKMGVETVGMIRSWDNCLSKGLLRTVPDKILANTYVLKEQLSKIHGVRDDLIEVVGLPQFDSFIQKQPVSREEFFTSVGFDPGKKMILLAPAGSILSDTDSDILNILLKAKESGEIPKDIQIFVRNHPHHPAKFADTNTHPDLYIQSPGIMLDDKNHKETELTRSDQDMLRNLAAHADVLVWTATSLCLDVLVYDVPEVVINFDGYQKKDYYHSVKRYHDEGHMKIMFKLKPFKVANSANELISAIAVYLKDRSVDKDARAKVREQQLFKLDGKSSLRIVKALTKSLTTKDDV